MPENYFDDVTNWPINGHTLEKLAKYGDPSQFELPIPAKIN